MSKSATARRRALPPQSLLLQGLLLGSLVCCACGSTDGTSLLRPAGSSGGGGSGGASDSPSGGTGGSSTGGATVMLDAGADATPDASQGNSCRVSALEPYCAVAACPASPEAARVQLQQPVLALNPLLIVQRACTGPDGAALISVSANYLSLVLNYIYDAQSRQLVSVERTEDVGCGSASRGPMDEGFGQEPGFYGEEAADCRAGYQSDFVVPASCRVPAGYQQLDAGALYAALVDAGVDAGVLGSPYECIVTP